MHVSGTARAERWRLLPSAIGILLGLLPVNTLTAQTFGRFHELKSKAIHYLQHEQFDQASALLEEVWEQNAKDALVAELLGIAYLNGDARKEDPGFAGKARQRMEDAIALGGQATFLVRLEDGKGRSFRDKCSGKLSVRPGRLVFVSNPCRHGEIKSFDTASAQLTPLHPRSRPGSSAAQVTVNGSNYNFSPYSPNAEDGVLIADFVNNYLGKSR